MGELAVAALPTVRSRADRGLAVARNDGMAALASTGWALGTGWSQGAGVAQATAVGAGADLVSSYLPAVGQLIRITYTIKNYSAGGVSWNVGTGNSGAIRMGNGTFTETTTSATGVAALKFVRRNSDFTGQIDDVRVEELS